MGAGGEKEEKEPTPWYLKEFLGITWYDYGKSSGCFLALYLFLGLFYAAVMAAGSDVRGSSYLLMPSKYFGA